MSPRKPVSSLYDLCIDIVTKRIQTFIERKIEKINFFNDYEAAAQEFLSRCLHGRQFIEDHFVGPLRWGSDRRPLAWCIWSRWRIMDHFLHVSSLQNGTRIAGYLLLFDTHQTVISFGHFPELCYPMLASLIRWGLTQRSVLSVNSFSSSRQTRLNTLNLRNVWLHGSHLTQAGLSTIIKVETLCVLLGGV